MAVIDPWRDRVWWTRSIFLDASVDAVRSFPFVPSGDNRFCEVFMRCCSDV